MADRAVTALLQNFIGYRAFISIKIDFIQYVLGCSRQSARAGVGGPRIKSHILVVEERNSQFFSLTLYMK